MTIRTLNTASGVIDDNTPEHIFEHEVLGKYLERVDEDAKPYEPTKFKPREADKSVEPKSSAHKTKGEETRALAAEERAKADAKDDTK